MFKVPLAITIVLIIIALIAFIVVIKSTTLELIDRVTSSIAIFACLCGGISATFVVCSYIHTNFAFVLSLKPSLLIQVTSVNKNSKPPSNIPITIIHYQNKTANEFTDLTLNITIRVANREMDISNLFRPKMFMAAHDSRNRRFETLSLLSQRGIDVDSETSAGNPVELKTGYSYTFNKKFEKRNGPEYKWNSDIQCWEIK